MHAAIESLHNGQGMGSDSQDQNGEEDTYCDDEDDDMGD
jgi:hypothetical protein